jgi:putative ABC transport system permease protein
MFRTTLKGVLAHKLRLVLTALSIVLGVAFVAGTFVLTDSMKSSLNDTTNESLQGVDAGVRSESAFENEANQNTQLVRDPIPAEVLTAITAVDGVADAQGEVSGDAVIVAPDGDAITAGGGNWNPNATLSPMDIRAGRAPTGLDEVVLNVGTVEDEGFRFGDTVRIATANGSHEYTLVGSFTHPGEGDVAGVGSAAWALPTAQEALDRVGRYDSILIEADAGLGQTELQARIAPVLPAGIEVLTGQELIDESIDDTNSGLAFLNIFLLTFALIALLVGAFIIYNTFSIIVTQRTKELALMRALGASPRQVRRSVKTESVVVGFVGSAIGLGLGFLVAVGLRSVMSGFGVALPDGPLVLKQRTIALSLLMGTIVTVLSSAGPARKAAKVAPIAAMRDVATGHRSGGKRRTTIGTALLALGVFGVVNGLGGGGLAFVGLGALAVFVGVSMVAPAISRPAAGIFGRPLHRFGMEGVLARQNSMRSARRTASTASALMIGLALVAATMILAASAIKSVSDQVERQVVAPYIIKADPYGTFSHTVVEELRQQPEIGTAYGMTQSPAKVEGSTKTVTAVDPAAFDPARPALTLGDVEGDVSTLSDGGFAVWDTEAENQGWELGDTVSVEFPDGVHPQQIEAIYSEHGATGNYLMAESTYRAHYVDQGDIYAVIVPAAGIPDLQAQATAQQIVDRDYPNLEVLTRSEFIADQKSEVELFVGLITVLLGLAIVIALLGVANTLALSIFERTREIGLLRAVGMTRSQLRRMVRGEAAIVAVFGAFLGIAVGVFFGVALVKALADQGVDTLVIPPGRLAVVVLATAVLGVLAATLPARKAAKLDVLRAITHD